MENHVLEITAGPEGILLMTMHGEFSEKYLPLLKEDIQKANVFIREEYAKTSKPVSILIDASNLSSIYDPGAIIMLANFEKEDRPYVRKTVCFGGNSTIKFAGEIISAFSDRSNISFFDTQEQALAALKETDSPKA